MSYHIIPTENSLTKGENRVLNKLKAIYEDIDYDVYIYVTPRVQGLEPDFIVVDRWSGKTVILIARAIYLMQKNPEWKILIVTYNKSLTAKIKNKVDRLFEESFFFNKDINPLNLEIVHFHKLALDNATIRVPKGANSDFWENTLPNNALENATPQYNLVLIDEYQDFYDNWIKCCIKMIIKNDDESVNLFLAGDRLQSIYNPNENNWKQNIGLSMSGRSKLLKSSYRSVTSHLELALKFLKVDDKLKKEVEKFYNGADDIFSKNTHNSKVNFLEGSYVEITEIIESLILQKEYEYKDIMVLGTYWNEMNDFFNQLPKKMKINSKVGKDVMEDKLTITTYHSSKGLENKICFLLHIDKILNRKLIYVGMTRASEHLYIHSKKFNEDNFAKELKSLS